MDPTAAAILTSAATIVSALFGALMFAYRQQREDSKSSTAEWKKLFETEAANHERTRDKATENQLENSAALREVALFLHTTAERRRAEDATFRERMSRERTG